MWLLQPRRQLSSSAGSIEDDEEEDVEMSDIDEL